MTWPTVELAEIADVLRGVTYKREQARESPGDGYLPLLRATNIGAALEVEQGLVYVPESVVSASQRLQVDDIVLASSSGSISVVGKSARLTREWRGTFGAFCAVVRANSNVLPAYLGHYLQSYAVRKRWSDAARGTNINNLKRGDLTSTPVPLPPLDVQRRIVDLLEDHLSRLDAADTYLHAAQRRNSVLHDQLLDSELAVVESEELPFAELLTTGLANGKSVPTLEGGFPVLRLTALRDGRVDLAERKPGAWTGADASRFLVERGDFLIARGNGSLRLVGRGGLVTDEPDAVAFPDTLIRARPDLSRIRPEFMTQVWNAHGVRRQIEKSARTTAGIYKVNQKDLAAVRVPVPSLEDQDRITAAVRESRDALSKLSVEVGRAITRSSALRRSLLGAAFSGRLTGDASDLSVTEEMIGA